MPARKPRPNDADAVSAFMAGLDHPQKPQVESLRAVIRAAGGGPLGERIKWNAPSYYFGAHDMAAFNFRERSHVMLVMVFPAGIMIQSPILEGDWKDRRLLRFTDAGDVEAKRPALAAIVSEWVDRVAALPA